MKIEKESVDVRTFLEGVFEEAEALNAEATVKLKLGNVPDGRASFDKAKIHHVLINLLENAIRYNKPGGDVVFSAEQRAGQIIISVKDSGIGIAPDDQPKIFDRFYRVDKARSREDGGTGLGLAIASTIAKAHGGNLSVRSVLGEGSEFLLWLPA
jgi:signal transduction histidine kinase